MENKMTPKQILNRLVYAIHHEVNYYSQFTQSDPIINQDHQIVDQALTEHEKQTQILEVLWNKVIAKERAKNCENVNAYNNYVLPPFSQLTEEEFNLIREWLCEKKN